MKEAGCRVWEVGGKVVVCSIHRQTTREINMTGMDVCWMQTESRAGIREGS